MNEIHSSNKLIYRPRWITRQVKSAVNSFPIVVITGARQVGKSTFLQNEFKSFKYLSLDDFSVLSQAKNDPASLWIDTNKIIIDEAQKAPELFTAIKLAVDTEPGARNFILSGSSNILLMKRISESLAGRAVYFDMLPMTVSEMAGKSTGPKNLLKLWKPDAIIKEETLAAVDPTAHMLKGFMPQLMHFKNRNDILLWWEGYVKTYIERDVRELVQVDSLIDFKRVLDSLALRTGNILNQTEVSRDTTVSQPTVYRYIKLLEVSNIISRLPSYFPSRSKRITKSPKLFFIDPGLSIYLTGYFEMETLRNSREIGSFFETMIYMHLKISSELMIPKAKIFYWRTTAGKEVDFVLEHGKKLLAFETKLTKKPTYNDIKNLLHFIDQYPDTVRGILIHAGNTVQWMHSKVVAVPWWWLWE